MRNKSFCNGTFPDSMNIAKVIFIYKGDDRNIFSNYRPISLLSQFLKMLEKLFEIFFDNFTNKNKILSNNQYGFLKKHINSYGTDACN